MPSRSWRPGERTCRGRGELLPHRRDAQGRRDGGVFLGSVPDKPTRDAALKKMQESMPEPPDMPFDGKRMIYGGFEPIVNG